MRRYVAIAISIVVALVVVYVIGSAGSERHAQRASGPMAPAQRAAGTPSPPATSTQTATSGETATAARTTPTITASRTDCRWRRYADGAISTDPRCAPGKLNPAVPGRTAQTICSQAWLVRASRFQPPATTKDELLIEYQLPGSPLTYVAARVVPVEDGGSPTGPLNLYPLPLNGYGGQQTRTLVADQLHDEICSHTVTVAQAAQLLEGDWLSHGVPNHD